MKPFFKKNKNGDHKSSYNSGILMIDNTLDTVISYLQEHVKK